MLGSIINIFRIRDLRNKIIFTVALLVIYRVGFHISVEFLLCRLIHGSFPPPDKKRNPIAIEVLYYLPDTGN